MSATKRYGNDARRVLVVIGVAGLALAVAGLGAAARNASTITPGAKLDQSNPYRAPACTYRGWASTNSTYWEAQTFTAGVTGNLTDVVLRLWGNTTPITVAIALVDGNGQPVVATPLASTSLALTPVTTPTDTAVSFSAPPKVKQGTQYAIVLSAPNQNATGGGSVAWAADDGSSIKDPNGTPCADGAYAAGQAWDDRSERADSDFFFQTYMLATPPAHKVSVSVTVRGKGRVTGGGIICPGTCKTTVTSGRTLTLYATAAKRYRFAGWAGACTGRHACTLHPTAAVTVTATFRKRT